MSFPWRTALFVSLALNIVIVSAAIGAFAAGARLERAAPERAMMGPRSPGMRDFMQALPPETRRSLRRELARELRNLRDERAAARQARIELYRAARAEPYDAARVGAAFARVREADAAIAARFHEALARALGELDPAERAAALEAARRMQRPAPQARQP